jgi:plastocyanin
VRRGEPYGRYDRAVKRAALILAAAALALVLAAPAFSGAAGIVAEHPQSASEGPAVKESAPSATGTGPVARLSVTPNPVLVDGRVLLDASRSSEKGARLTKFTWDLNGDGAFESDSGTSPRIHHVFTSPGTVRVGMRVVDDRGASAERFVTLAVPAATTSVAEQPRLVAATEQAPASSSRRKQSPPAFLHSASATTVNISSFKFVPGSVSVHVGDTVTWINHDSVKHSAKANDGTFDTGLLDNGKSAAFKFTRAGTYQYHCSPHPFMTANIKVVGSGSGGSGGSNNSGTSGNNSSSGGSSPSNPSSNSSGSGKPLPHTGLAIASLVLIGLGLLGAGVLLRGGTAPHRPRL